MIIINKSRLNIQIAEVLHLYYISKHLFALKIPPPPSRMTHSSAALCQSSGLCWRLYNSRSIGVFWAAPRRWSPSHSWSSALLSFRWCVWAGVSLNTPRGWSACRTPRSRTAAPPCGCADAAPGCQGDWSCVRTAGSGAASRLCAPDGGAPASASVWSVCRRSRSSAAARLRRRTRGSSAPRRGWKCCRSGRMGKDCPLLRCSVNERHLVDKGAPPALPVKWTLLRTVGRSGGGPHFRLLLLLHSQQHYLGRTGAALSLAPPAPQSPL